MPQDCGSRCGEFTWVTYTIVAGRRVSHPVKPDANLDDPAVHCSYCGSMTPEAMMSAMRAGAEIGPTDKPYKIYVGTAHSKFYTNHMTSEEMSVEFWAAYTGQTMKVGYPGHFYNRIWLPAMPKVGADRVR